MVHKIMVHTIHTMIRTHTIIQKQQRVHHIQTTLYTILQNYFLNTKKSVTHYITLQNSTTVYTTLQISPNLFKTLQTSIYSTTLYTTQQHYTKR